MSRIVLGLIAIIAIIPAMSRISKAKRVPAVDCSRLFRAFGYNVGCNHPQRTALQALTAEDRFDMALVSMPTESLPPEITDDALRRPFVEAFDEGFFAGLSD